MKSATDLIAERIIYLLVAGWALDQGAIGVIVGVLVVVYFLTDLRRLWFWLVALGHVLFIAPFL